MELTKATVHKSPLSDIDLNKFLSAFEIPIVEYDALPSYDSLEDLMGEHNCVVIFNKNPHTEVGHWTLLLCYTPGDYEFFDSVFGEPDAVQKYWKLGSTHLKDLKIRSHDANITFGSISLQSRTAQTCGRWVLDRILKMKMRAKDYYALYDLIKTKHKRLDVFIVKSLAIPI